MSENRNREFAKYDSMTTEELEEILRRDADAPGDGESDVELLLYVMEVLANRRNTNNTGKTALEAWESFQQHYLSDEEVPLEYKPKRSPWLRRMIAAAAVVALVVVVPLSARAFGLENIWNVIAKWAKETFSFISDENTQMSEPDKGDHLEYTSLQDALQQSNIDAGLVPTWIPDGYTLDLIEIDESPMQESYNAQYLREGKLLTIRIITYMDSDPEKIEINENLVEIYENSDIQYFIFSNYDQRQAIWTKDSYECVITGELTIEEIKAMIDSVGANQ